MPKKIEAEGLISELLKIECMEPDLEGLTPKQINALHHFKYKLAALVYRLYMDVPEKMVNRVLSRHATIVSLKT